MICCPTPDTDVLGTAGEAALRRIAGFAALLRQNGFSTGLAETQDAARIAVNMADGKPSRIKAAFRSLFCSRASDWKAFDALFESHWLGTGLKRAIKVGGSSAAAPQSTLGAQRGPREAQSAGAELPDAIEAEGEGDGTDGAEGKAEGASKTDISGSIDFRKIADPEALAKAHAAAERLARVMRARLTRRERQRRRGRAIDLRATIRRNAAHGGVPLELAYRKRKDKPLRVVLLLDASGSMQLYTAVFTRFIHGMLENFHEAEAFVFHTRLAHVSSAMRERNASRALERLSLMSQGVGGGTRIGECLSDFNQWHAKRVLNSRSCVMILSDGYDTGDPQRLGEELRRLRRRCRRIVWLNPMMGWEGYAPEARAMKAALPHIDVLAPAHSLDSLAALEPVLAKI